VGLSTIGGTCDCRCGYACANCCDGSAPDEWSATFTFYNDPNALYNCSLCAGFMSDVYILTKGAACYSGIPISGVPGAPPTYGTDEVDCCWYYDWEGDETCLWDGANPDLTFHLTEIHIRMVIECYEGIVHITRLLYWIKGYYEGFESDIYSKLWNWCQGVYPYSGSSGYQYHALRIDNCQDVVASKTTYFTTGIAGTYAVWPGCGTGYPNARADVWLEPV